MKRGIMRRIIPYFIVIVILIFKETGMLTFLGVNSYKSKISSSITTENFNVEMIVDDQKKIQITETIDVNFNTTGHGIYRNIPYRGKVRYMYDGEIIDKKYFMRIKDVYVENEDYNTSIKGNDLIVKIGNKNKEVYGNKKYVLHYECVMAEDEVDMYDYLYFNVIPHDWQSSIKNANIKIKMPKEFNSNKLEFIGGIKGDNKDNMVNYYIENNEINATIKEPLVFGEGITFKLTLDEGYFIGERISSEKVVSKILIPMGIIFLIISIILWFIFGRDKRNIYNIYNEEFYPPNNMNSAEVACIANGRVTEENLFSLIIYWANLGYLNIVEWGEGDYGLIKKADLPMETSSYEKTMFYGIFKDSNKVDIKSFAEKYYGFENKVKRQLKSYVYKNYERNFITKSCRISKGIINILMCGLLLIFSITSYFSMMTQNLINSMLIGILILIYSFFINERVKSAYTGIFGISLFALVAYKHTGMKEVIILLSCIVILLKFIAINMRKKSIEGYKMYSKLEGFRDFLYNAESSKAEELYRDNPNYYYENLSYAYAFDTSNSWTNIFSNIRMGYPKWYCNNGYYEAEDYFRPHRFTRSFHRSFTRASREVRRRNINSNGSGGAFTGGGGTSGGGCGGGGGGGW